MLTFKNDKKIKKMLVDEVINHRKQDQIIKGTYGKENGKWKGCAVGCAIHSLNIRLNKNHSTDNHAVLEEEGIYPEWLARLQDTIFEGLPAKEAVKFPEQFTKAIPVGVDLTPVKWKFCAYLMKENIKRVLSLEIEEDLKKKVVDAIQDVLSVHEKAIETGEWDENAARSAARSAANAARSARSAWSAWSAAESAWSAAESARSAWSAAESARSAASAASAERSAWSAAYKKHAKELIRLLKEAV